MAVGSGIEGLFGIKKASTWGTSVAVGASNCGFRPIVGSWMWDETPEPLPDMSFNADAHRRARTFTGRYDVAGKFAVEAKYDGLDTLIALMLGTAGVPSGGGAPYTHTIYRKNDMTGIFFSLGWYDGIKTHEIDSAKFDEMKISGTAGRVLRYDFSWFGRLRSENTATNANLSSLTENSTIAEVQWLNSTITYQIAAFASSLAAFTPLDWEVTFKAPYNKDAARTSEYILEPHRGDVDVTGAFGIPYEATTLISAAKSGAQYKGKLVHTVGSLQHNIWLPSITFEKADMPMQDKSSMTKRLTFRAEKAASTPSTFSQAVPYVELLNNNSANPLA